MTIERISFEEGLLVTDPSKLVPAKIATEYIDKVVPLPVDEYNITPSVWLKRNNDYNLIVNPDGSGILRILPRYNDVRTREISSDSKTPWVKGGKTYNIPSDQPTFVIAGPKPNHPNIYIFEFIFYIPGPSPLKIASEPTPQPTTEIITTDIRNINQAKKLILEDAKIHVLALNWNEFGIGDYKELTDFYEAFCPLILRQSEMSLPLNILNVNKPEEKDILDGLPFDHKSNISENFWLAILTPQIKAAEATFIRDWLLMKFSEIFAQFKKLPPEKVIETFMRNHNFFRNAGLRAFQY